MKNITLLKELFQIKQRKLSLRVLFYFVQIFSKILRRLKLFT